MLSNNTYIPLQRHKMNKLFLLALPTLCLWLASCSNDDDKYRSTPPTLSEITIHSLEDNASSTLYVGDRFVATAVQSSKGHLLYKATYKWTISPTDGVDYSQRAKSTVIYDNEPSDPTDTIVINTPGEYNITLNATYGASGTGSLYYKASVTKRRVKIESK